MKNDSEAISSDQSLKPRRPKSREVSSRFLSPTLTSSIESGIPSPNQTLSPTRRKPGTTTTDTRKHRSHEDSGFLRGLWPSSASQSSNKKVGTLADHLGNERLKDLLDRKDDDDNSETNSNVMFLNRQRSCTQFTRFEKEKENTKENTKENHRPIFGGSMRYTGKFKFPGKSSSKSSSSSSSSSSNPPRGLVPGRMSVDENALSRKPYRRKSDPFLDNNLDSESECSDGADSLARNSSVSSSASYMSSTVSSRRAGIEVSSKFMHNSSTSSRRWSSDSIIPIPVPSENSPKSNKFTIKNAIKRANSLTGYGSAMSPGRRSSSPPIPLENKRKPMTSSSNLKPPTSPSRAKGMEKLLNMGLELFKSKKHPSSCLSPAGSGSMETIHQLRYLHNRLLQWRYANARADAVSGNITNQAETKLLCAWDSLTKLQHSVVQKKLQLQKEKLEMKLNFILHSQIKPLEAWGDMERQHLLAVSMTKDCFHSVVCRVPLIEGAKVDPQSASIAIRHASDLTASIKSMLTAFSPSAEKIVSLLSELAEVVALEKSLLDECHEHFRIISTLEAQEKSLECNIIQFNLWQQQQQQQLEILS
ncbi:hypothetical protein L1049_024267 [Liquidambar formosana]|uniref:QWRF motif-containing protein 3 n=1 Tax=Liquidambar formosana TaxID=63359 RepID=A0AAP0WZG4_LIQFO